jgi:tripartite-type tricarboxylate transporter receptor subunit TctC
MRLLCSLLATVLLAASPAGAQTWPSKPIRFIVPYAPGGIADTAARVVGAKLTEALGQQIVVENRPGGNATIGISSVVKAAPDGYTILVATSGDFTLSPAILKDMTYDVEKDLAPVSTLTDTPILVAVHTAAPYKTLAEFIADAKAKDGKLSYASPGNGGINQLLMEWLALEAGFKVQHIPYKGGAPSGAAVAAGDVPVGSLALASALPHIKAGRIRILAQTGAKRSQFLPDVPTAQELGIKNIDGSNWTSMSAPRGTPQPILDRLHAEVVKALEAQDVKARFNGGLSDVIPSTPAELAARIKRELAFSRSIVAKANISAD